MDDALKDDLKEKIAKGEVVVVVGAGVSMGATGNCETASWLGLLTHGIEHCRKVLPELDDVWQDECISRLGRNDMISMLGVAEEVSARLEVPDGEFTAWLRSAFQPSNFPLRDRSVIKALHALRCPIITTNYDGLIEKVTRRQTAVWNRSQGQLGYILNGEEDDIFHVHGFWKEPKSVILGIKDYGRVKNDAHTRAFLEAAGFGKCLLFVGCGDGLEDSNFGALLKWLEVAKCQLPDRSFRLALKKDVEKLQKNHPLGQRISVIPYGEGHGNLAVYLESLAPAKAKRKRRLPQSKGWKAYLEHLAAEYSKMPLTGLAIGSSVSLPIGDAYVPLRTTHTERWAEEKGKWKQRFDEGGFADADLCERNLPLGEVFKHTDRRGILLLGNPGSGKTTGLRQWAWRLASGKAAARASGLPEGCRPVFLRLGRLPANHEAFSKDPDAFFRTFLDSEVTVGALEPVKLLEEVIRCKVPLLWLVDGLDEISDPSVRVALFGWLEKILRERKDDRVLTAGRFQGVEGVIEQGSLFARFLIQPLQKEDIRKFVGAWFSAVFKELRRPPEEAGEKASALVKILEGDDFREAQRAEIKANPLLLTILCIVYHEDDARLPKERARVYDRCVTVMLDSWRRNLKPTVTYDAPQARSLLGRIAWWLHQKVGMRAFPMGEVEDFAGEQLASYKGTLPESGFEFVSVIKDHAGLLAAMGDGKIEFVHLTFQEFLAAEHAANEAMGAELAAFFAVPWWREPIELALSQGALEFSRRFFRRLLEERAVLKDAAFFKKCLDMAREVDWEVFAERLRSGGDDVLPLMRAVRVFKSPEVLEVCEELEGSDIAEVRSLAREMLGRKAAAAEPVADIVETAAKDFSEWTHVESGVVFVRLPAERFWMGSPEDEAGRWAEMETRHDVRLSRPFWIAKYPVTNAAYEKFVKATDHRAPGEWDDPRFNQPSQPVVGVDWNDAVAFSEWVGGSLPTEAQWEYACRAGTETPFAIGDGENISSELANFNGNYPYGKAKKGPFLEKTTPVGSYAPNPWDLYDMHGNVWEWCRDRFGEYEEKAVKDPTGAKTGEGRVLRGGSWFNFGRNCRSAYRSGNEPARRDSGVGFRPAREILSFKSQPSPVKGEEEPTKGRAKGAPQRSVGKGI